MHLYHNSQNSYYRMPLGSGACGEFVSLKMRAEGAQSVKLRLWWDEGELVYDMEPLDQRDYACTIQLPAHMGLLWYYFVVSCNDGRTLYYGNALDEMGGEGLMRESEPPSYQITVYDPAFNTPEWMRNGVMMQVMVDRYARSGALKPEILPHGTYYHSDWNDVPELEITENGDNSASDYFGGNLKGLTDKLAYISQQGITAIYLNPIFQSPSNHKYDTGDYKKIDPSFGTQQDFEGLCARASELGIRIILDGVFSHTGADSLYFNKNGNYGKGGAYCDPNSPYHSWYRFEKYPEKYDSWWGFETLPNVNEDDPAYRAFIIEEEDSVLAHWLRAGASGWRLDVADELPMDFLRLFRQREKQECAESALIGEVWEDPSNKVTYGELRSYCLGDTLDSVMNYPLRTVLFDFLLGRIDADDLKRHVDSMCEKLPKPFLYAQMNLTGSHDKARAISILADAGNMEPERMYRYPLKLSTAQYLLGKRRLMLVWQFLCALPGMPCVYYGDEAGMQGMSDPYCRATYPWGREDAELVDCFRSAAHQRLASHALRTGDLRINTCGEDVIVVERSIVNKTDAFGESAPNEHRALAVNRADQQRTIEYRNMAHEIDAQSALWIV